MKKALSDADLIAVCVKSKTGKNQRLLAEKKHFFREYSKFSHFGQNTKSQFCPIFIAELWKPRKIANTYRILVKIALFDAKFIEGFVKTKTSKNQRLLAEK